MNVLFTNVGRRTYLLKFALELKRTGYPLNIFVNDVSKNTAGFWVSDDIKCFVTPQVSNNLELYFSALLNQCMENKIDLIIPLMDYELLLLSKKKKLLEKEKIKVAVSDYDTILNCLNKEKNFIFCRKNNIDVPMSYFKSNEIPSVFPMIKKRIYGSASIGLMMINDKSELSFFNENEDMLQEYIEGQEYGMDILNDFNGTFVHAAFREKIAMRAGETDKAKTIISERYTELAKNISNKFKHVGSMDIDFIVDKNDDIHFIDFNPRFGGGYPITHLSGFNYIKYVLDLAQSKKVIIPENSKNVTVMKGISLNYYENIN